jgi:ribonuclease-3
MSFIPMKLHIPLLKTVRLLANYRQEPYLSFRKILGFMPRHIDLYKTALTHKSYYARKGREMPINNERLEFLGDSVLGTIVADILYKRYKNRREGFLTSTRSKIVSRSSLNHLAVEIGLPKLIRISKQTQISSSENIYGNAFEALIGAIYLDRGYDQCRKFIERRIMTKLLDIDQVARKEVNHKSRLLEWGQKHRRTIEYRLTCDEKLPRNEHIFYSSVFIDETEYGNGNGRSKRESEQKAALMAYRRLTAK